MELVKDIIGWATLGMFFIALALLYGAIKSIKIKRL